MGIKVIHPQPTKRRKLKLWGKRGALVLVIVLIVGGAAFYGQHGQWHTGHALAKIEKYAQKNKANQQPLSAQDVTKKVTQKNIVPDYSGAGGLADKKTLLSLAKSAQPELLRGRVIVPSFNINEPIYEGTSDHVLTIGVGFNEPNVTIGQGRVPIFGHNMGDYDAVWPYQPTKFSALQKMSQKSIVGQAIYVSDGKKVFEYRATKYTSGVSLAQLNASLTAAYHGQSEVQLIACLEDADFWRQVKASGYTNFHAEKRIILTGKLVKQTPIKRVAEPILKLLQ